MTGQTTMMGTCDPKIYRRIRRIKCTDTNSLEPSWDSLEHNAHAFVVG
jgi:hypothetical protein